MSGMSYISVIERFHEYENAIHGLLGSILSGIAEDPIFHDKATQCKAIECLGKRYPFVELLYVLDKAGVQAGDNIAVSSQHPAAYAGNGTDRSHRPYFKAVNESKTIVVTPPYLSTATRSLCVSAVFPRHKDDGAADYLVLDVNLSGVVEFLMGDTLRRRFQPFFKFVYGLIVTGLFFVVGTLLYTAASEMVSYVTERTEGPLSLKPFSGIIFLTLALAVFDLGKTTLEEEVLMHKDIFRHSSTRRTITRFIAAILIAVSIEALLLMFKAALGHGDELTQAVWMMVAAVGLLIGLGTYVYLGAKAESILLNARKPGASIEAK